MFVSTRSRQVARPWLPALVFCTAIYAGATQETTTEGDYIDKAIYDAEGEPLTDAEGALKLDFPEPGGKVVYLRFPREGKVVSADLEVGFPENGLGIDGHSCTEPDSTVSSKKYHFATRFRVDRDGPYWLQFCARRVGVTSRATRVSIRADDGGRPGRFLASQASPISDFRPEIPTWHTAIRKVVLRENSFYWLCLHQSGENLGYLALRFSKSLEPKSDRFRFSEDGRAWHSYPDRYGLAFRAIAYPRRPQIDIGDDGEIEWRAHFAPDDVLGLASHVKLTETLNDCLAKQRERLAVEDDMETADEDAEDEGRAYIFVPLKLHLGSPGVVSLRNVLIECSTRSAGDALRLPGD